MAVQVDKQGQMLSREVLLLHKKMDGETTRRSFVTRYMPACTGVDVGDLQYQIWPQVSSIQHGVTFQK